jgi:uncharacterized protein
MVAQVSSHASPPGSRVSGLSGRLQIALRDAIKAHDAIAISALRSALGAIGNAEAVDQSGAPQPGPAAAGSGGSSHLASTEHFAGSVSGLAGAEVRRRPIGPAELEGIVRTEIAERQLAAGEYERLGQVDRAARLRHEASVLLSALTAEPGH